MKRFRTPWFWWCVGAGLTVIALIWTAYWFNWPGTGFQNKKVWDWLQLVNKVTGKQVLR
ncbi:MAG: hypothetical protein JO202_05700 [Ktedonobacteraceae bacterium]|nr:hypothetical protein [Ktedonobacteraceae bacterium]